MGEILSMKLIISSLIMIFIFFIIKKAIGKSTKAMAYYLAIASILTIINLQGSYDGKIDIFISEYLLPIIIPFIVNGIIFAINRRQREESNKNQRIVLFQLYRIIYIAAIAIIAQILILLLVLKYVFYFDIGIALIISLGVGLFFLIILTINVFRYKIEKIVILSGEEKLPYEYVIPLKTYVINREEFINIEVDRAGVVFCDIKNQNNEIHYIYLTDIDKTTENLDIGNASLYKELADYFKVNTFNHVNVSINETNVKIKRQNQLKSH